MPNGDTERGRLEEQKRYSKAGLVEMAMLENALFDARKKLETMPDDRVAALEVEAAEKDLRLFYEEHDNAGAFKFKKFGRRIGELFEPGPDGKTAIEAGEDGELKLDASQADRRFLLVNMGELDRFNAEGGGHAAGDAALGETAHAIQQAVDAALEGKKGAGTDYQIYRLDGNTFAVDLASISAEDFSELAKKVQEARPSVPGVKEPAPLTVRGLDFAHIVDVVNQVQAELPKDAKLEPGPDAAHELVEVFRRAADWDLEVNKFMTRADRVIAKIEAAERVIAKVEAGEADAASFFESYAKKSFQGTELESFEDFRKAVKDGTAREIAGRLAMSAAEKRFADGRRVDDHLKELIDARVRERGIPMVQAAGEEKPATSRAGGTAGQRKLDEALGLAEAAEAMAASAAGEGDERRVLELQAHNARRDYQIEAARRDLGTGLLERGVHYEDLERGLKEGRDIAVVFVDMGFLKYFDQMGGKEVGDEALKEAARLMEGAVRTAGVKGEVYRYGGDEFTIQVEGGAEAAGKVMRELEDHRKLSAPIPAGEKSRSEYAPTRLSFNYGLADAKMLETLYDVAAREGKYPEEELADETRVGNIKAELMTKAADVGIEYNKAYDRFMLLIQELRDPAYESDPARRTQVDALITFSNKAVFGGVDTLRALAADRSLQGEALEEAVLDHVVDKVAEARSTEKGQKQLLDLLLAAETKIAFLSDRLKDMEDVASDRQHKIVELQEALRKAEAERRQLIDVRGAIDQAA